MVRVEEEELPERRVGVGFKYLRGGLGFKYRRGRARLLLGNVAHASGWVVRVEEEKLTNRERGENKVHMNRVHIPGGIGCCLGRSPMLPDGWYE